MRIDAHQHFWDPALADYPWMTDDLAAIRRRFGPAELEPLLKANGIDGTVVVQARSSLVETSQLIETAAAVPFVLGVVGWVDLTDSDVGRVIGELRDGLVGIRHQTHDEPDPRWLLRPDVDRGLTAVGENGLVFDLLVRTAQLPAALEAARRHPEIRFVVDHLAKPPLRDGSTEAWAEGLAALAGLPNVGCKLSGLVTEADWNAPRHDELVDYLRRALAWFGPARCMFGSDWPVCLLAATYDDVLELAEDALTGLDAREHADVLGGTAARTYGLSVGQHPGAP